MNERMNEFIALSSIFCMPCYFHGLVFSFPLFIHLFYHFTCYPWFPGGKPLFCSHNSHGEVSIILSFDLFHLSSVVSPSHSVRFSSFFFLVHCSFLSGPFLCHCCFIVFFFFKFLILFDHHDDQYVVCVCICFRHCSCILHIVSVFLFTNI